VSSVFRMDTRERWALKNVFVETWLKEPTEVFGPGDPLVILRIEGELRTLNYKGSETCGIYSHHVKRGHHVGPWGFLLEYTEVTTTQTVLRANANRFRGPAQVLKQRVSYPRVFLSYRRDDADAYAGRLHQVLAEEFGKDDVFMDLFSIRGGEVFPWTIQQAIASAVIAVVLIGPKWFTVADSQGKPRLESEYDYVRREVSAAGRSRHSHLAGTLAWRHCSRARTAAPIRTRRPRGRADVGTQPALLGGGRRANCPDVRASLEGDREDEADGSR
jgi:TIR domain